MGGGHEESKQASHPHHPPIRPPSTTHTHTDTATACILQKQQQQQQTCTYVCMYHACSCQHDSEEMGLPGGLARSIRRRATPMRAGGAGATAGMHQ